MPAAVFDDGRRFAKANYDMLPDESFVNRLRAGEPAAYGLFVERFEGPLYRFFLCDHRNHHTAQEQTAETFAELVRSLKGMQGGHEQLRAFVYATARHIQLRRWRGRKKGFAPLSEALNVSDAQPSAETVASDREELARVLNAIGQLDDPSRNVLLLRFVEGCSINEVAEALGLPVGTVKSHIHRSRTRLKQILADKEYQS